MYQEIINEYQIQQLQKERTEIEPLIGNVVCFNFMTVNEKLEEGSICGVYGKITAIKSVAADDSKSITIDLALETSIDGFYSLHKDLTIVCMTDMDGNSPHPGGIITICLKNEFETIRQTLDEFHAMMNPKESNVVYLNTVKKDK